jgi:hypothetical protein
MYVWNNAFTIAAPEAYTPYNRIVLAFLYCPLTMPTTPQCTIPGGAYCGPYTNCSGGPTKFPPVNSSTPDASKLPAWAQFTLNAFEFAFAGNPPDAYTLNKTTQFQSIAQWKAADPKNRHIYASIGGAACFPPTLLNMYQYWSTGNNASVVAQGFQAFVQNFNAANVATPSNPYPMAIEGIDFDFEVPSGAPVSSFVPMLAAVTTQLNQLMPSLLISHAPQSPYLYNNSTWGQYLDMLAALPPALVQSANFSFNIQFYNQGPPFDGASGSYDLDILTMLTQGGVRPDGTRFPPMRPNQLLVGQCSQGCANKFSNILPGVNMNAIKKAGFGVMWWGAGITDATTGLLTWWPTPTSAKRTPSQVMKDGVHRALGAMGLGPGGTQNGGKSNSSQSGSCTATSSTSGCSTNNNLLVAVVVLALALVAIGVGFGYKAFAKQRR